MTTTVQITMLIALWLVAMVVLARLAAKSIVRAEPEFRALRHAVRDFRDAVLIETERLAFWRRKG